MENFEEINGKGRSNFGDFFCLREGFLHKTHFVSVPLTSLTCVWFASETEYISFRESSLEICDGLFIGESCRRSTQRLYAGIGEADQLSDTRHRYYTPT